MRMKPEHYQRLYAISRLPHLTLRSQLIVARRLARQALADRQMTRALFRDAVQTAEAGLPFTQRRLEAVKRVQKESRGTYSAGFVELGGWLYQMDETLTLRYGFDGICDLLEVNPAHRPEVLEYAEDTKRAIAAAAFIAGREDSASSQSGRRPADWKRGPFFEVFLVMTMDMVRRRPDAMPDPTAPGGPLYGITTYTRMADGTMARNAPTVTVHDAQGSRVVKGGPRDSHA